MRFLVAALVALQTTAIGATDWEKRAREAGRLFEERAYVQSVAASREVIAMAINARQPAPAIAAVRCELGQALWLSGAAGPGHAEMSRALEALRISGDPIDTSDCARNFASLHWKSGNYRESSELYKTSIAIEENLSGREQQLARAMAGLAAVDAVEGRHAQAEQALRKVLRVQEKYLAPGDPDLGDSYYALAMSLRGLFRQPEASRYAEKALEVYRRASASKSEGILPSLCLLAATNADVKRSRKAEEWAKQIQVALVDLPQADSQERLRAMTTLAYVASQRGDMQQAERSFEEARLLLEQQPKPDPQHLGLPHK